jgi:hypothetical protein
VGTGFRGERKSFAAGRVKTLRARIQNERDLAASAVEGDSVFGRMPFTDDRGALVAYESNFAFIELGAVEFNRYLTAEGLDRALVARRENGAEELPGRERYARCPKTWIAGSEGKRATKPVGLTLELIPLSDPSREGPLELEVRFRGKPLAEALVRIWRQPLSSSCQPTGGVRDSVGPRSQGRTDASGRVTLPIQGGGEWLASAVHMVPSQDPTAADWESYWASLTFARCRTRQ